MSTIFTFPGKEFTLTTEGSNLQQLINSDICLDHCLKWGLRNQSMTSTPAYRNVLYSSKMGAMQRALWSNYITRDS